MRGSTPTDMIVASGTGHATKHYMVREDRDFSNNNDSNDSYLDEADMSS
jgi:hypothetical protein